MPAKPKYREVLHRLAERIATAVRSKPEPRTGGCGSVGSKRARKHAFAPLSISEAHMVRAYPAVWREESLKAGLYDTSRFSFGRMEHLNRQRLMRAALIVASGCKDQEAARRVWGHPRMIAILVKGKRHRVLWDELLAWGRHEQLALPDGWTQVVTRVRDAKGRSVDGRIRSGRRQGWPPAQHPTWDRPIARLLWLGRVARVYKARSAPGPVSVLDAFQAANWPPEIPDPTWNASRKHPEALKRTVRTLNLRLKYLRFSASGGMIRWKRFPE